MKFPAIGVSLILLIICTPTAIIHPLVPFGSLLLLYILFEMYLSKRVGKPDSYLKDFGIALLLLIPTTFGVSVVEGGLFVGGPFYTTNYTGELINLTPCDSVCYKAGYLISYKGEKTKAPVLAYVVDQNVRWASRIETEDDGMYWINEIVSLKVHSGLLRDRIDFFAGGISEPGWGYIWKFGGFQKFYLMPF